MFKEKSSKKKINTDTNETYTLDAMHNNMIKNFENTDKELSYYNNLLNKYELSSNIIFNELNKETNKDTINILWSSNIDLREKIIDTKNKIKELNNNYDEIEYYKNTSYILFQYYDTVDKQSHINNALIGNNNIIKSSVDLPIKQSRNVYKSESKKKKAILLHNTINVLDALNNINNNTNCEDNNTSTSNIENNDIFKETHLELEKLTFNENKKHNYKFKINRKENILF